MRHKRKSNKRKRLVKQRLLILCEGETERNYFLAMREDLDFKQKMAATNIEIIAAKNSTPEQILKEAKKKSKAAAKEDNSYQKIWLVFDHDNHTHRRKTYDEVVKSTDFEVVFSAICFEMWYLLHFTKSAKIFTSADELIQALKKHYPKYQKAKQNDFSFLKEHLKTAIENAKWLRKRTDKIDKHITDYNPWTDVDLLINYLS